MADFSFQTDWKGQIISWYIYCHVLKSQDTNGGRPTHIEDETAITLHMEAFSKRNRGTNNATKDQ